MNIARIALPVPLYKSFDYLVGKLSPVVGARVRIPFGRQFKIGIVLELVSETDIKTERLKNIAEVLDDTPLLPPKLFNLVHWASFYYQYPLGDALSIVIPAALRQGKQAQCIAPRPWALTKLGKTQSLDTLKRAPKQAKLFSMLQKKPCLPAELIKEEISQQSILALAKKGWITQSDAPKKTPWQANFQVTEQKPKLNTEQAIAIATVHANPNFACYLLDGVTGSGKTEVYLNLLEKVLLDGKQALILVPEIGLTPQTINRFKKRFNVPICVVHSALNDAMRLQAWLNARDDHAAIIIGTRSALFSPLQNLGIIIIDEEHDLSYKQQDSFRYHARDLAVMRAHKENIPIILGSATPSFESLNNAWQGKYHHLHLTQRAGNAKPPKCGILDIKGLHLTAGVSQPLLNKMREHLAQKNQVMLFLNRRGYAPALMCHECGWLAECPRCDSKYTLHQKHNELRCHHCQTQRRLPHQCSDCGSTALIALGTGTEQLETQLSALFPECNICRIDRDNTRRKGELENYLNAIHKKQYQILIGTQMLAKGHHFPDVTLVALVDVDSALFSQDFRAPERLAQLFVQVAGRAGRASKPGEVLLQTHHPEHALLQSLVHHGYKAFAKQGLEERKQTELPPFSLFCLLRAESHQQQIIEPFLAQVKHILQSNSLKEKPIYCIGPMPAPMARRAGKYRWQLIVQASSRNALHHTLHHALSAIHALPEAKKIRWSIDVEPQDMA